MDVVVVRWPAEAMRRAQLADRQVPRLLLIEDEAVPPDSRDCLEDWIRPPATDVDVRARVAALTGRAERHLTASTTLDTVSPAADTVSPAVDTVPPSVDTGSPTLDGDGVLRFRGTWVSLPPVEARLTVALVDRFGAVVSRDRLTRAGWPDGARGRNALDVHVLRLRRRINPLGLAIHTVRSRGYLLERSFVAAVASNAFGPAVPSWANSQ